MLKPATVFTLCAIISLFLLFACTSTSWRPGYTPPKHPPIYELGQRRVFCVKCHGEATEPIPFQRYDHTITFTDSHRQLAYQNEQVCASCHAQSFCNDCHVAGSELKPSIRNQTENYRRTQHRGDYLSRHRIDARVDPTSCFRCHGNPASSQSCVPCHG